MVAVGPWVVALCVGLLGVTRQSGRVAALGTVVGVRLCEDAPRTGCCHCL